jgi:hypothetical protein
MMASESIVDDKTSTEVAIVFFLFLPSKYGGHMYIIEYTL